MPQNNSRRLHRDPSRPIIPRVSITSQLQQENGAIHNASGLHSNTPQIHHQPNALNNFDLSYELTNYLMQFVQGPGPHHFSALYQNQQQNGSQNQQQNGSQNQQQNGSQNQQQNGSQNQQQDGSQNQQQNGSQSRQNLQHNENQRQSQFRNMGRERWSRSRFDVRSTPYGVPPAFSSAEEELEAQMKRTKDYEKKRNRILKKISKIKRHHLNTSESHVDVPRLDSTNIIPLIKETLRKGFSPNTQSTRSDSSTRVSRKQRKRQNREVTLEHGQNELGQQQAYHPGTEELEDMYKDLAINEGGLEGDTVSGLQK